MRLTTLELAAPKIEFSAGHFTLFSSTEREPLHGHNYHVTAAIQCEVDEAGITFNYSIYKHKLIDLCRQLNSFFIVPAQSPYLRIEEQGDYYHVYFYQEMIPFLKKDVRLLPIKNATLEELSYWFLQQLTNNPQELINFRIHTMELKVFNGLGQNASATWRQA